MKSGEWFLSLHKPPTLIPKSWQRSWCVMSSVTVVMRLSQSGHSPPALLILNSTHWCLCPHKRRGRLWCREFLCFAQGCPAGEGQEQPLGFPHCSRGFQQGGSQGLCACGLKPSVGAPLLLQAGFSVLCPSRELVNLISLGLTPSPQFPDKLEMTVPGWLSQDGQGLSPYLDSHFFQKPTVSKKLTPVPQHSRSLASRVDCSALFFLSQWCAI